MRFLAVMFLAAATSVAADSIQAAFEHAVQALATQDYASAEQGFQAVLKAQPGNLSALGNLGVVYSRTHQYTKAINTYRLALRAAPNELGLLLNLGLVYIKQEQYSKALPLFAKATALDPKNNQAKQLLATCQLYTDQVKPAAEGLEALRAAGPPDPGVLYLLGLAYYRLKEPAKAEALATEMMAAATPAQANLLMGKANYESGRFETSADFLRKALEADPHVPGGHRELGKAYVSLRRNGAAEAELKQAVEADPSDSEALYFLGGVLVQEGKIDAAASALEKARGMTPDFWGNYYYLGRIRLAQGKAQEAAVLLEQAARLNPEEASVYYQLSRALKLCGKAEESRRALTRVKELRAGKLGREVEVLADKPR